jgi:hypothetical protein
MDGIRQDQQDRGIRQDKKYRPEYAGPRGQKRLQLYRTKRRDRITKDHVAGRRGQMGLGNIHRTDRNSKTDRIIQKQQNMHVLTGSTGQMR